MFRVYLAGTISGLSYNAAAGGWRREFNRMISPEIKCYSPMRAKEFLADKGKLFGAYEEHPLATESGIVARDRNDVMTCDVMVACFLESQGNFSLGTAIEFGWADAGQKPIIMVAREGDPHREHPMLRRLAGYIVDDLPSAVAITQHILLPGI